MTTPTRPTGSVAIMAEQCTALSPRAVVAAAAPVAAQVGARVLAAGGDAHDAVVAAALAETVLLPPKCGLAGDLVALVWPKGADRPEALLAIGGAPAGLADVARSGRLDDTGPMSVGVPGAPAGYLALAERGRLGLAALAEPAIALARDGFCWSTICTVLAEESADLLARWNPGGSVYLPSGRPVPPGDVVRLPGLAEALTRFVADGPDFLSGPVGRAILDRVAGAGGVLAAADLAEAPAAARWESPASRAVADGACFATPAPTHGPSLLDAIAGCGAQAGVEVPPATVHDAVLAAIGRRRAELADPSGTSMVSAVDADGTLAVVVHSNSYPRFGSGLVVTDYDLILSNRAGRGFSSDPDHPNFPAPGRRPATTLHAWGWARPDGWRVLGATPGGANQMPWNAQSLARLLGREVLDTRALGTAVVAPRWEWIPADDGLRIEAGYGEADLAALAGRAPRVESVDRWALRSAMQIVADTGSSVVAVADPRTVGAAVAL